MNEIYGQTIPDAKLSAFLNVLVNTWWTKWKRGNLDDAGFDAAMKELWQIMDQGNDYPIVSHLCISMLYELDARLHGGYTKVGRDKLLMLIRAEGIE